MIRRPPRSTLFPTRRSSDLLQGREPGAAAQAQVREAEIGRIHAHQLARAAASFARDGRVEDDLDRKSTRLNSSHVEISYAVFCLKKKKKRIRRVERRKIEIL